MFLISNLVADKPTPSFNSIKPSCSNNNKALASLVPSFGTTILLPFGKFSNEEDVQYELVYRCKECNKIHGRIQIFSTK